ncbi:hypothetical protein L6452_14727 [Arctium lappa]|uniref:Uncharacterized protein n=1 Tax=Arctium lappa TaxID=4217 RepID=A0ACB9CLS2_ARCLA|nr:hypothetical protein L6452_14727 [Arctium lappa]
MSSSKKARVVVSEYVGLNSDYQAEVATSKLSKLVVSHILNIRSVFNTDSPRTRRQRIVPEFTHSPKPLSPLQALVVRRPALPLTVSPLGFQLGGIQLDMFPRIQLKNKVCRQVSNLVLNMLT